MTSSAALSVIRHAATLAIGLVRSGSYRRPGRAENEEKFAEKLTQSHLSAVKRPDPGQLSLPRAVWVDLAQVLPARLKAG